MLRNAESPQLVALAAKLKSVVRSVDEDSVETAQEELPSDKSSVLLRR